MITQTTVLIATNNKGETSRQVLVQNFSACLAARFTARTLRPVVKSLGPRRYPSRTGAIRGPSRLQEVLHEQLDQPCVLRARPAPAQERGGQAYATAGSLHYPRGAR